MAASSTALDKQLITILQEALVSGASVHLSVISQSMSPLLKTGDIVIVEHVAQNEYNPGDIIVFESNRSMITHRLLAKQENHWLTKGDNAINPDPPLRPELILGKVSAIQKENHILKIHSRFWQYSNRTIASINLCQMRLLKFVDRIISQIFGEKQIRGISLLYKLLTIPFRISTKLLILSFLLIEKIPGRQLCLV